MYLSFAEYAIGLLYLLVVMVAELHGHLGQSFLQFLLQVETQVHITYIYIYIVGPVYAVHASTIV